MSESADATSLATAAAAIGLAAAAAGVDRRAPALVEGKADGALAESAAIIPIPSRNTGRRNTKTPFFLIS